MIEPPDLLNRVHQFALAALDFSRRLPNTPQARAAGDQLYRACVCAEANYRAAQRGRSRHEFIAKLAVAVEGIGEAIGWLEHIRDGKMASNAGLLSEAEQLRTIFGRALGTARQIQKARERCLKDTGRDRSRDS